MIIKKAGLILATAAALTMAGPAAAQKKTMRIDGFPPGTSVFEFTTALAGVVQKKAPYEFQISTTKPATRGTVDAAGGKTELFMSAPSIYHFMKTKTAMFKDNEQAPELLTKLRGIVNYPIGSYQIVVYEDSGIKSLKDLKGKKVFLGPPGGAGTTVAALLVEAATGMKPGNEYEQAKLDWATAQQAFQDRQIDVHVSPTSIPSASIEQFALTRKIRLLGLPEEAFGTEAMKTVMALPARTVDVIPAKTYGNNQSNETDVKTVGSWVGLSTHVGVDENDIYAITKTMWDNIDELRAAAPWMKIINKETAFKFMNVPLHKGAYRYYKEAGFNIPPEIVPKD